MNRLFLSPRAEKDLKKLERPIRTRINRALLLLLGSSYPHGAKNLHDERLVEFRIRAGDYRILYDIYDDDKIIYILRVGHRKDIYR